jgi:AcrR family transcriptional regulator
MVGMTSTAAVSMRARILGAATDLTTRSGWSSVTMSRLADAVGVSRQTVYNEVGSKSALAEAMILDELARFLEVVATAFGRQPDNLVDAVRSACRGVLDLAADNTLLKAVVSATHGADTELLPLLTTHAEPLMMTAKAVIAEQLVPYDLALGSRQLEAVIDMVVRVVLSHVMAPSNTPANTADDIAWIAAKVLDG